ncbi:MAG: nitroreductase family protein [Deltaproteobacteria bacterium]|nr:nitroreductase family protein [Deltaproteobacteria bacterium]
MLKELVQKSRSYRRFYQEEPISLATLEELVDLARLTPSAANKQPLKYLLINTPEKNEAVFQCLAWAGYLKDWDGPTEGEKPAGYIVMLGDKDISVSYNFDNGIAAQTIMLGAVERGLGGCMIVSIKREKLAQALAIPNTYEILIVLALGKPKEKVILQDISPSGDVKYWRDAQGNHYVPKRPLREIIL